jgi:hypothetical protein
VRETTDEARREWPSAAYLENWKAFRGMSNENAVTAAELLKHPLWPQGDSLTLCDIGCGDGKVAQEIVRQSRGAFREVRLVDPDEDLLEEAIQMLASEKVETRKYHATAAQALPGCAEGADVALLAHVVYLLPDGELEAIFRAMPVEVPLVVVMDAPDSVFTSLWAESAPKYHARSLAAHATIAALPRDAYFVETTRLSSLLPDPRAIEPDGKIQLLAILCYTDRDLLTADPGLLARAEDILGRYAAEGQIRCDSMCYVIQRLS